MRKLMFVLMTMFFGTMMMVSCNESQVVNTTDEYGIKCDVEIANVFKSDATDPVMFGSPSQYTKAIEENVDGCSEFLKSLRSYDIYNYHNDKLNTSLDILKSIENNDENKITLEGVKLGNNKFVAIAETKTEPKNCIDLSLDDDYKSLKYWKKYVGVTRGIDDTGKNEIINNAFSPSLLYGELNDENVLKNLLKEKQLKLIDITTKDINKTTDLDKAKNKYRHKIYMDMTPLNSILDLAFKNESEEGYKIQVLVKSINKTGEKTITERTIENTGKVERFIVNSELLVPMNTLQVYINVLDEDDNIINCTRESGKLTSKGQIINFKNVEPNNRYYIKEKNNDKQQVITLKTGQFDISLDFGIIWHTDFKNKGNKTFNYSF